MGVANLLLVGRTLGQQNISATTSNKSAENIFIDGQSEGSVTSKYKFEKILGSGSFSCVRKARNRVTKELVACKVIPYVLHEHESAGAFKNRLTLADVTREVTIAMSLDHPNIIKTIEFFHEHRKVYVIQEYLDGGDLASAIDERGSITENDARDIFLQILAACRHMHARGVIHRDLKLANVLICREGDLSRIKIIDFGLAGCVRAPQSDTASCHERGVNQFLSTECGTPMYVAPEVISSKSGKPLYGPSVDIWGAGIILFFMLSGYPPFHHNQIPKLLDLVRKGLTSSSFNRDPVWQLVTPNAKDLILKVLVADTTLRLTADQALCHTWCQDVI